MAYHFKKKPNPAFLQKKKKTKFDFYKNLLFLYKKLIIKNLASVVKIYK